MKKLLTFFVYIILCGSLLYDVKVVFPAMLTKPVETIDEYQPVEYQQREVGLGIVPVLEKLFEETDQTAYLVKRTVLQENMDLYCTSKIEVPKYLEVKLIGVGLFDYNKVEYNGKQYYVQKEAITTDWQDIVELHNQTYNTNWHGPVLNRRLGTVKGPNGRETYYNLNMTGVINIMRRMGNTDIYWIREDGVKMLGDYVMVAANLKLHPRGSLVQCSLGIGIVCDTGGFASVNPEALDIAVNWR